MRNHLTSLTGHGCERLFVLTPDADEPKEVATLREDGEPVFWSSFAGLYEAICDTLSASDVMLLEHHELLLRELARLFKEDGLLTTPDDVVVVAAGNAYPFYRQHSLYVCQAGRGFSPHIERIGFYRSKGHGHRGPAAIQREFAEILWHRDGFDISAESIAALADSDDSAGRAAAEALRDAVEQGAMKTEWQAQVFLLSAPEDGRTRTLTRPIVHHGEAAWTQKQRNISSRDLSANPETTADLDKAREPHEQPADSDRA